MYIQSDTFAGLYEQVRPFLLEAPILAPRGEVTKELLYVCFELTNPRSRLAYHPKRKLSLPFIIAESVLLFDPSNALHNLYFYNPRMKRWSDDGKTMYGSYGHRISEYIPDIIKKLQKDIYTRQAVLHIFDLDDLRMETKDVPCTMNIQFLIRNNKLDVAVAMRSQDIIWGFFNDLPVFTFLQEVIANEMGVYVGNYYHTCNSLHVYQQFWKILEEIEQMEPVEFSIPYKFDDISDLRDVVKARRNMTEYDIEDLEKQDGPFEPILAHFYRRKMKLPNNALPEHVAWAQRFLDDRTGTYEIV